MEILSKCTNQLNTDNKYSLGISALCYFKKISCFEHAAVIFLRFIIIDNKSVLFGGAPIAFPSNLLSISFPFSLFELFYMHIWTNHKRPGPALAVHMQMTLFMPCSESNNTKYNFSYGHFYKNLGTFDL